MARRPVPARKQPAKPRPPGTTQRKATDERRRQIRTAAYRCFAQCGYHDTSVDEVCEAAGISKGAFYWHYKSKDEVFIDILDTWATEVETEVPRQFRDALTDRDPWGALAAALRREGHRGRRVLPVWLDCLVQSSRNPALRTALARFLARIRKALTEILAPALFPIHTEKETATLVTLFLGSFIGSISQALVDPEAADFDRQVEQLIATIARYVSSVRPPRPVPAHKR